METALIRNTTPEMPRLERFRRPLSGHLQSFRDDILGMMRIVREDCGDVAALRIGVFPVAFVVSPELAFEVLQSNAAEYKKSLGLALYARPLIGNGLLSSAGEEHRRQRKLMAPAFHHQAVASYAQVVVDATQALITRLPVGQSVDVTAEMTRLTLAIATRTLFHADLDSDAGRVSLAFTEASEALLGLFSSVAPIPWPWPSPVNFRLRRAVAELDKLVYRLIAARRAGPEQKDVLGLLLATRDEATGEGPSDKELRDQVITLFLAGHETTANALSWALDQLERHPQVADRLATEAQAVFAGRAPVFADLARLPYAGAVLKETMRLFPPAYFVGRRSLRATQLGPYPIPKGQTVLIGIHQIQRRPEMWGTDAELFRPERFLEGVEQRIPKGAYIPFGAGPRVCIGQQLALMEGQLILAMLAERFAFSRRKPEPPLLPRPLITLRPGRAFELEVRRR